METLNKSPKNNLRAVFFMACVTLIVCNSCALAHTDVTVEQARDLIESTNDLFVVDVREPYEYCDNVGHIPGALNYPLSSGVLEAQYGELPKDASILVVCRSGGRSNVAANFLNSKGFSTVYDMMRGMSAWEWETEPCKDDSDSGMEDSTETNTYVFLSDESTVVQIGGIAGLHETYPIQGQFQLKVDVNSAVAVFSYVDAFLLSPVSSSPPQNLGKLFNMATLVGEVLDDKTISFMDKADDGSKVLITVTKENNLAYLVGETIPPPNSADFFLFSLDAVAQRKYGGGTGEPDDPYQIATAEDLMLLGESPEDCGKHFILTADIDLDPNLPGRKVFDKAVIDFFWGVFNGNGHTISHLTIKGGDGLALFRSSGFYSIGEVRGVGLVDVNITGSGFVGGLVSNNWGTVIQCYSTGTVSGNEFVGGLVGRVWGMRMGGHGTVSHCYSTVAVSGSSSVGGLVGELCDGCILTQCYSTGMVNGNSEVGGLVGSSSRGSNVAECYSTGAVNGREYVGGLIGANGENVDNCHSTALVSGTEFVGGLVGYSWYGSIAMSYSTGTVTGYDKVGGLVGQNNEGSITDSSSNGTVIGNGYIGGLVGVNADSWKGGNITNCYNTGTVTASENNVGGLVGYNGWEGSITTSYNTGDIYGNDLVGGLVGTNWGDVTASYNNGKVSGNESVGGLVGFNYISISNSYSTGRISADMRVGGLVGYNYSGIVNMSFWDVQTSGQNESDGGTAKTRAEMQTENTFTDAGWDFVDETANGTEDIWWINEGNDYPKLWWELISNETSENFGE